MEALKKTGGRTARARLLAAAMTVLLILGMMPATALAASTTKAAITGSTIPAAMTAGQAYTVKITVKNTGTTTWTAAGNYKLVAVGGTDSLASSTRYALAAGESIRPNATKTFTIKMTAPLKSGKLVTDWQMYKGTTKISSVFTKTVTVSMAQRNSVAVSVNMPAKVVAGSAFNAEVTYKNIGSTRWTPSGFRLIATLSFMGYSQSFMVPLGSRDSIATGGTKKFIVPMQAPYLDEDFTLSFQMSYGSARFGEKVSRTFSVYFTDAQLLENATEWVEYAESTHLQMDLDYAREMVDALPDSPGKAALEARLDELQNVIDELNGYYDLLSEAKAAVLLAETTQLQADVDAAQALVSQLQPGAYRSMLQSRIDEVQADIDDQAAIDAVIARIAALPLPAVLALSDKPAVVAARAAYDALSAAQQPLVTNYAVLQAAEARIAELEANQAAADQAAVLADAAALAIGYAPGDSADGVKHNVTLPTAGASGTAIAWASGDAAIGTAGQVTRPTLPEADKTVTLTATVTRGDASTTKAFTVKVLAYPTNAEAVEADAAAILIGYATGDGQDSVTQNLTLPIAGTLGSQISWRSDNYAVIRHATPFSLDDNGRVFRPIVDTTVTLTATIAKGAEHVEKVFTVTVKGDASSADALAVLGDWDDLAITYAAGDSADGVKHNLGLSAAGSRGTTITWESGDGDTVVGHVTPFNLGDLGRVTRPTLPEADKTVTLTATIAKGGASKTKIFTVKVLAYPTDAEAVEADAAAILIGYAAGDSADSVTQNLSLPAAGQYGTQISWTSGNYAVIRHATPFSSDQGGRVFRPAADTSVTLTALVVKGTARVERVFTVLVKGDSNSPDALAVSADAAALEIGYAAGDSASYVTQNLTLAMAGSHGTTITWESSDEATIVGHVTPFSINSLGRVTRPTLTEGDKSVTLTATIAKGGASVTRAFTVTVKAPQHSAYAFSADSTISAVAGVGKAVDVTLATAALKDIGYDHVRINVSIEKPNGATVSLLATDSNGHQFDVAQLGYWGPASGFPVTAGYSATTAFTGTFSDAGAYTITMALKDLDGGATLATKAVTVNVIPAHSSYGFTAGNGSTWPGLAKSASVQLETTTLGAAGYAHVRVDVSIDKPAGATVSLMATDSNGHEFDVAQLGYWGPPSGFPIAANYSETTTFTGTFSAVGTYTITMALKNLDGGATLATKAISITVANPTNAEAVEADKAALSIGYAPGDSASSVTDDLTLTELGRWGSQISWRFDPPMFGHGAFGSSLGKLLSRPLEDTVVTVTATIAKGGVVETRDFTVTVKADTSSAADNLRADRDTLQIGFADGDSLGHVTQNVVLTAGPLPNGSTLYWTSSDAAITTPTPFGAGGVVSRGTADKTVTLTAHLTNGALSTTKVFTLTVLAQE